MCSAFRQRGAQPNFTSPFGPGTGQDEFAHAKARQEESVSINGGVLLFRATWLEFFFAIPHLRVRSHRRLDECAHSSQRLPPS